MRYFACVNDLFCVHAMGIADAQTMHFTREKTKYLRTFSGHGHLYSFLLLSYLTLPSDSACMLGGEAV